MDLNSAAILFDALERMSEVIVLTIDRFLEDLPQPIPRRDDLKLRLFRDDVAFAVEGDPLVNNDADVDRTGAALVQSLEQFQMGGENPHPTADQLD